MSPETIDQKHKIENRVMGRLWPNLVVHYDSEKGAEFRVQCEVLLDKATAQELVRMLGMNSPGTLSPTDASLGLQKARALIEDNIPGQATETFRKIVSLAFEDQPEYKG
jgi:hypothetical protein